MTCRVVLPERLQKAKPLNGEILIWGVASEALYNLSPFLEACCELLSRKPSLQGLYTQGPAP